MLEIISLLVCSLLFLNAGFIESNLVAKLCSNDSYNSNISSGRIYRANLDSLLSVLNSNASRPNGFYNFTTGNANDPSNGTTIHGLFLCRGDVGISDCQDCMQKAAGDVLRLCPNRKVAIIWYDKCMLQYANRSIFSPVEGGFRIGINNRQNVSIPNRDLFGRVLQDTFRQVMARAVIDVSGKKFAVSESNVTESQKIYALGQCFPYLSSLDCFKCLRSAVAFIPDYYPRGGRVLFPSCNVRYEAYSFFNVSAPRPPPLARRPPPPPALPPTTPLGHASSKGVSARVAMTIVFSAASCITLLIIWFIFLRRRSRKKRQAKSGEDDITIDPESLQYSLSEIETATNNFSAENKIGQGGFGSVYKGKLSNGQEIAVKRLLKRSGQGAAEFKNEIVVVAKLQHRNLVQLLGFCLEGEEKILVFEFVPRRSLDYFLFDTEKQGLLNWSRRRKIIGGIARGLLYLHEDSRLKIVHRDLEAGNILLDESMHPKIADFGMAKICGIHESEGNTTTIAGTFGYMAPEYRRRGHYSVKSDVFSFGVVILEILTGKKNSTFYRSADSEDLIIYAWRQWRNGTPLALLDPKIGESYVQTEVIQCVHIGLLCVEEDANKRPTMATIVNMLNSTSVSLPTPQCPAVLRDSESENQPNGELFIGSINEASITEPYAR